MARNPSRPSPREPGIPSMPGMSGIGAPSAGGVVLGSCGAAHAGYAATSTKARAVAKLLLYVIRVSPCPLCGYGSPRAGARIVVPRLCWERARDARLLAANRGTGRLTERDVVDREDQERGET